MIVFFNILITVAIGMYCTVILVISFCLLYSTLSVMLVVVIRVLKGPLFDLRNVVPTRWREDHAQV